MENIKAKTAETARPTEGSSRTDKFSLGGAAGASAAMTVVLIKRTTTKRVKKLVAKFVLPVAIVSS